MWPYFIVLFLILIFQLKFNKKDSTIKYWLSFLVLFLFAGLRGNGDGDYFAYIEYSTYINTFKDVLNPNFPMEIGFRVISYVVNTLGINQQYVIISMNFISLICIYKFIKKYSKDKMLSVLLFLPLYFQYDMHAARTAVAIGIATCGFKYIYEKEIIKYLLVILLAACFHKTAIILLPIYFLNDIKIHKYFGYISIIFIVIISNIFSLSNLMYKLLVALKMSTFASSFITYANSERFGYPYKLYDPRLLLVIGIYILAETTLDKSDKIQNVLINITFINIIIILIFRENTAMVTRLSSFFNIYTIITIPYILYNLKKYKNVSLNMLSKLVSVYIYIPYIVRLLVGAVEYKLFFI